MTADPTVARPGGVPPALPVGQERGTADEPYDWSADVEVVDAPVVRDTGRPVDPPDRDLPPVYATVTGRDATTRRPIVPAWLRSRADAVASARFAVGLVAHTVAYHLCRMPKYMLRVVWWAPVGAGRLLARLARWVAAAEDRPVRDHAATKGEVVEYLRVVHEHERHVHRRGWALVVWTLLVLAGGLVGWLVAPWWVRWPAVVLLLVGLARVGRPADKPLTDTVVVTGRPRKLTAQAVRAALCALGIGAMKQHDHITFPKEISRDGPGYLASVDLPHGVTTAEVIDRRGKLASALRVPVDQCWPETVAGQHAGRLDLWVADEPVSAMRQPSWPLARSGTVDVFREFPFGTDPRKRPVEAGLIYRNWLLAGIPGSGKSAALRLLLLAASLDKRVELRGFELKGSGDLDMFAPLCGEYGSGPDDDTAEAALGMLRWARRECTRRAEAIKRMAAAGKAPENKVTGELAGMPGAGLHPVVLFIDELQELMTHDRFGAEAGQLATAVIKLGRALGLVLVLATQRPDKDSLPTGISANVSTRFCLRVMGQVENDMVLGTSAYRNGIRSTQWTDRDLGWGWLVGVGDPVACHAYYVDGDAAKRVVARAVALRGGPVQHDRTDRGPRYDLIADVRAAWPEGEDAAWSEVLAGRLARLRPDVYQGWEVATLNAALRAAGVSTRKLHRKVDGAGVTRHGVRYDDLPDSRTPAIDSPADIPGKGGLTCENSR